MELSLSKLPWYGTDRRVRRRVLAWRSSGSGSSTSSDMQSDIDARQTRLTALRRTSRSGKATARRLPEFQAQVTELERRLENLRAVLPEEKDVADILRRVQGLATQSNLTIQRFTPQPPKQEALYAELPYKLTAEGTFHDLGVLLRSDQQVPANHQRRRDLDQGEAEAGTGRHHRRGAASRRRSSCRKARPWPVAAAVALVPKQPSTK